MKFHRFSAFLLAATLGIAACDGDSGTNSNDLERGEFEGQVAGDFSFALDGEAVSGSTVGSSSNQDVIDLFDASEQVEILALHLDDFFSEGSESLTDGSDPQADQGIGVLIAFGETGQVFVATDGVMDVDDISSGGIRGSLSFDAVEIDPQTFEVLNEEVSVDADFNAQYSNNLSRGKLEGAQLQRLQVRQKQLQ